ncbi:helix-turn-helix domain-containing protein [Frankia sp. AvcI1]|uniref:helix-turn-helix domain-containing protein n=1 Tax=Frankia sp. AvcI1 TaxID=573496 RepID=UPI0006EBF798|nr:helix-turn-helix domain-containing protein [Frankia sp. AvcI1]
MQIDAAPPRVDGLLKPGEARTALRISATTLARWARAGTISAVTLPSGHRRYRHADITAILAGAGSGIPDHS